MVVTSSRELARHALGRRLEDAAAAALPGHVAFVRLRSQRTGQPDAAALKVLLERDVAAPTRIAPLDSFVRSREAHGADGTALRRLERTLRSALVGVRAFYAPDAVYLLGFSPVAGVAGLRVEHCSAPPA
jgi:hypothetical protein